MSWFKRSVRGQQLAAVVVDPAEVLEVPQAWPGSTSASNAMSLVDRVRDLEARVKQLEDEPEESP